MLLVSITFILAKAVTPTRLTSKIDAWRTERGWMQDLHSYQIPNILFPFKSFLQTQLCNKDYKYSCSSQCFGIPKWSCPRLLVTVRKWFHFTKPTSYSVSWIPVHYSCIQPTSSLCSFPPPQHINSRTEKFVSHYLLVNDWKEVWRETQSSIHQASWISAWPLAKAQKHFWTLHIFLWWYHDSPFFLLFFFFPSLLSPLPVSVLNLLCNEVTQGLGTSPGTNHQGFSASCDGQTRGSDFTAPGTNKHGATAAALARMKKATRLHASAQHWGGSEWGQIFHSIARGPSYGKFQSVKAKCYWNVAFLQLAWNFLLLLNLEKQVWKIHPFPHGACSYTADCVDSARCRRASVWQHYLQTNTCFQLAVAVPPLPSPRQARKKAFGSNNGIVCWNQLPNNFLCIQSIPWRSCRSELVNLTDLWAATVK